MEVKRYTKVLKLMRGFLYNYGGPDFTDIIASYVILAILLHRSPFLTMMVSSIYTGITPQIETPRVCKVPPGGMGRRRTQWRWLLS